MMPDILAFDIGGSKIEIARVAADGAVTERATLPTPHTGWDDFAGAVATLFEQAGGARSVGLSIAGTVDPATGIANAANIPSITGQRVEAGLAERLGIPVRVGNDADCFALAEAKVGVGKGLPIIFAVILGTGVGGGVVIGGRMVRGAHGVTGEWGHGPVLADSVRLRGIPIVACGCGQVGCVDVYGSARGLEYIHEGLSGTQLPRHAITAAWHEGDAAAERTIEVYVDLLSAPLSMIVNTLGPSVIPVGGGLSAETKLLARIDAAVRARVLARYDAPLVVPGATRGASGLIGAAMLAAEALEEA
jgi:N-acetylglucosamine kinase